MQDGFSILENSCQGLPLDPRAARGRFSARRFIERSQHPLTSAEWPGPG